MQFFFTNYNMSTIVIAITNDYNTTPNKLTNMFKDREILKSLFEDSKILYKTLENNTLNELELNIKSIFKNNIYKHCVIIFSGHGYQDKHTFPGIFTQDSKQILLRDIIENIKTISDKRLPNLCIIDDACRIASRKKEVESIYEYSKKLLILHPIKKNEVALISSKGSYLIRSICGIENRLQTMDDINVMILKTLYKYVFDLKKLDPTIYVNEAFRSAYPSEIKLMMNLTNQSKESIMATKIRDKHDINLKDKEMLKNACISVDIGDKHNILEILSNTKQKIKNYKNLLVAYETTEKKLYENIKEFQKQTVDIHSKKDYINQRLTAYNKCYDKILKYKYEHMH